jgi:16S rRNA (cytosine1402-N4)-methyltransferase
LAKCNHKKYILHEPVLKDQVVDHLIRDKSGLYVDGTIGSGGHAQAILGSLSPKGSVVGIDRDAEAIDYCREKFFPNRKQIQLIHGEFGQIDELLDDLQISKVDGMLLDLGISNHQLMCASRGFSYQRDGFLDMRMNAIDPLTARDVINRYSEKALANIFYQYGEERHSRQIAREIVKCRDKKPIETTGMLAGIIRRITPSRWQVKTLSRIFQSIRIEINYELNQLINGLIKIVPYLKNFGCIVCISYHSLEDRIVKHYFKGTLSEYDTGLSKVKIPNVTFRVLTKKVVRPDDREIQRNPNARSALLRSAELVKK